MTTWTKTRSHLAIALLTACLASCSLFQSDPPRLIDTGVQSKLHSPVQPPAHFVVTVAEARSAIPITKYNWHIYADRTRYYLLSDLDGPKLRTSEAIRQYGYPLSGDTRHDIDRVLQTRAKNRAAGFNPDLTIQQLSRTLPRNPTP